MHLLSLLIAAVLSSQFVAPNTFTTFTVDLKAVTVEQLSGGSGKELPVIEVTFAAALTSAPTGFISLENSATTTTKVDITTTVVPDSDNKKYTIAATDLDTLDATGSEPCIYIWLKDGDMADAPVSIQVPVAEAWTIAKDPAADFFDTDLVKTPKLKIAATHTAGWTDTGMKAKFSWEYDPQEDPREVELDITKESTFYIIAADKSLADLEILTADVTAADVPLVVSIILQDGTEYPLTAELLVKPNPPTFTMATTLAEVAAVEPIAYTITNTGDAWTGKTVKAVFTTTKTVPAAATGDFAFEVTVADGTFSANLATFPFTDELKEIYVYLHITTTAGADPADGFRVAPAAITFTPEPPVVGTFTLAGATVEWKNRATTPNITVAITGTPTAPTPKARYEIVYTPQGGNPAKVEGELGQTGGAAPFFIAPTSLAALNLPNAATTLKVSIFPRGARKSYATPQDFTVTPSTAEFTVGPSPITSLTTIDKLTITATDGADWSDDGIAVKLSFESANPIVKNLTLEVPEASTNQVVAKVYSLANVDITTLGLANGSVVTVEAAKAQHATTPVWLPIPVPVTVTLPVVEEETFTLTPAWMLWAADLKTTEAIIVEPSKEVTWTTPKATFTYTAPGPVSNDPAPVEVTLVKAGTPEKWTIPKATALALLEVPQPAEGEFATVNVTVHNGAKVLAHEFPFKVYRTAPAPGPETITFTLAPNKMDFATAMKTPVIEVKPGAGANWPAAADPGKLKATFKYGDKPDIAADLAVEGTTTKKYTIPKDVDLSTFGIKETECPKVIKVHIKDGAVDLTHVADFTVNKPGGSAAMGVSPLLSLLAAALLLLVKLF